MNRLDATDYFQPRHIGPSSADTTEMLAAVGAPSLDALIEEAIPASIRLREPLNLAPAESEHQYLQRLTGIARKNKTFRSYIGLGYHDTITPSVILRMVMENPGW
jgi:glycine dehydrogenase